VIRYALACEHGHGFEGWFRNSEDFEAQAARSLVICPTCGSSKVSKALMAPAVAPSRTRDAEATRLQDTAERPAGAETPAAARGGFALADPGRQALIEQIRALRQKLRETADDVGAAFPEEARKIHYGEAKQRGIYGQASPEEAAALIDEGIAVLPLPVLPEDRN